MTWLQVELDALRRSGAAPEGGALCPYCSGGCVEVHEEDGIRWCRICSGIGWLPEKQAREWDARLEWIRRNSAQG